MTYRGRVQNGAVVLDEPAELPEGAQVEVAVLGEFQQDRDVLPPTLYDQLKDFIGIANDIPSDGSTNLDHYLHDSR